MSKNHRMPELRIPEMPRMLRAALYIRVSHEEQVLHGYSIEAQKQALTEYALKNHLHIVDYYIDEGQTARKSYSKRKEFVRLMEDVRAGNIDIILFIKLDRWFRSIRDYYKIQDILEKHNVNWKTIYEDYDTSTASGRLHINIMLSVAQDEADRTSERIKFVFENKVRNNEVITGSVSMGYQIKGKKLVIVPEEAEIVREIYKYYLYRQSKSTTMTYIREKFGIHLLYRTITRILTNRFYIGEYRDETNYCEPIIDRETFEAVQRILKSNIRETKTRFTYVYAGLLRCPVCGRTLTSAKIIKPNNTIFLYYRCYYHYQNKLCPFNHAINEKKIDKFLLDNIMAEIKKNIVEYEIKGKTSHQSDSQAEAYRIRKKLERLKELYLEEMIQKDTYRRDYEELTAKLDKLEKVKKTPPKVNIAALQAFLDKDIKTIYESLSPIDRQALWRSVIKEIHFDKNTLKPKIFFC
ncbi:recombinase family protein [Sporomusa sphaeroides]|uniref:recombinase family protein n=1 Tax=Sporomusa sphaeroides TaxID=47679 RepID=UPI003DA12B90